MMYAGSTANGCNAINTMNSVTKNSLTNKEAITINQDVLGRQGYKILDEEKFGIFMRPLADGDTAICLFTETTIKLM